MQVAGFVALRSAETVRRLIYGLELPVVPFLSSLFRKRRGAPSALSGSERIDALRYQRIKKAKKMTWNNNNSKTRKKAGVNPDISVLLKLCGISQNEKKISFLLPIG